MISAKLIELIEIHAGRLSSDVAKDLATNARTKGFRQVPIAQLEQRMFQIFHFLGDWIGEPKSEKLKTEFREWGAKRFGQGIPLSEIVYSVIVLKLHLRKYIQDNGLVDAAFPRVEADYILPMHMHSLQDLNSQVGTFFDEALYWLVVGYEKETATSR